MLMLLYNLLKVMVAGGRGVGGYFVIIVFVSLLATGCGVVNCHKMFPVRNVPEGSRSQTTRRCTDLRLVLV